MFQINVTDWRMPADGPVLAYFDVKLKEASGDAIIIYDFRLVNREQRKPLVAFPSRPGYFHCACCHSKCLVTHNFCSNCGVEIRRCKDESENSYHNIVHPIDSKTRASFEVAILKAYEERKNHS